MKYVVVIALTVVGCTTLSNGGDAHVDNPKCVIFCGNSR